MDIDFNIVGSVLGSVSIVWNGIQSWMLRQRATQSAIDRVEVKANQLHAEQEARLIRVEETVRHVVDKDGLLNALKPLYDLVRKTESQVSGLASHIESQGRGLAQIQSMIMQRGIEK